MKLNLGCGFNKKTDFVNVDYANYCEPDVCHDLAKQKWPWADQSITEVYFEYSLEQMGENHHDLKFIFSELYRICSNEAKIFITGLYPRHDQFYLNPMCTQKLSPDFFQLLSKASNLNQIANGSPDLCLAMHWEVNFEVSRFKYLISNVFQNDLKSGKITESELQQKMIFENNVCQAYEVDLVVRK